MTYFADHIAGIIGSSTPAPHAPVEYLLLDSRKIVKAGSSLFFALKGDRRNGSQYIADVYKKGVRLFVVSEMPSADVYPEAAFMLVPDTLMALQQLAAHHRQQFSIPVIGITGSNGKTIVKEWLHQLLQDDYIIARSPKSYNSQIGVPLSVWQLNGTHTLAIFEAGISQPGEMKKLQDIIQPTIGVFTNLGAAHSEGFSNQRQKATEKMKLFAAGAVPVLMNADVPELAIAAANVHCRPITWSMTDPSAWIHVISTARSPAGASIHVKTKEEQSFTFNIPFTDDASIENAVTCCAVLMYLAVPATIIQMRMPLLQPVNMRLELKKGINHCLLINDSYSADPDSLQIALDFLDQQQGLDKKTVILSDFPGIRYNSEPYMRIFSSLQTHGITRVIAIGKEIGHAMEHSPHFHADQVESFATTGEYIDQFLSSQFKEEIILLKGARIFEFEKIAQLLELKAHQTVLEINLNAIVHNVNAFRRHLKPRTRIMAMVKAFAYGSGGAEIAGILQYHQVDYLGVAYADEGVELRRAGITLPIMVMNPEAIAFESIVGNNLEPDLYSFEMLQAFESYLHYEGLSNYPVHIEIETGMNRLGFALSEVKQLAAHLQSGTLLSVQSVFSHLAGSEDASLDEFTRQQFSLYKGAVQLLHNAGLSFIQHLSNSAAVIRFPELELDMVRLGIGLYGIDSAAVNEQWLLPVATLKTTIAQLKKIKAGESVSYNRRGIVQRDSLIATVRVGYADGYSRKLGNGVGRMWLNGKFAPVIGTVCMDMTMIDVTGIPAVKEGDEVIVFGSEVPIQEVAAAAGTIPYEIMTGISQRVKRVYFEE